MTAPAEHDAYLATLPDPQRLLLQGLREQVHRLMPGLVEVISYRMPGFRQPGPKGKVLGGYAGFKAHASWFPHSGNVLPALADRLAGRDWNGGTLRFTAPLPDDLVAALLAERLRQIG